MPEIVIGRKSINEASWLWELILGLPSPNLTAISTQVPVMQAAAHLSTAQHSDEIGKSRNALKYP